MTIAMKKINKMMPKRVTGVEACLESVRSDS